jgi:hypothetical protein
MLEFQPEGNTAMLTKLALAASAVFIFATPASAVNYTFYGFITSRQAGPGTLGAFNWSQNSGFNPTGISLSRADNDGYASAFGSQAGGGTLSSSVFGSVNAYAAVNQLAYDLVFDAPATVKAKISMTAFGNIFAWGSGYSVASFKFGDQNTSISTFATTSQTGAATLRNFKWTRSATIMGGQSIAIRLAAQSFVNTLGSSNIYGPGGGSAFIDPVVSVASVPEPASWAMLVTGFGVVGGAIRARRRALVG